MSWHPTSNASFLGYSIVYPLLVWFIIPFRDCNVSFSKLWLQATACNFFNVFGWFHFQLKMVGGVSYCEVGWGQPGCRYSRCSKRRVSGVGSIWSGIVHMGREWKLHSCTMQGQQHLRFLLCLRKPRLDSNRDQEVKVSVAHLRLPLFHCQFVTALMNKCCYWKTGQHTKHSLHLTAFDWL